MSDSGDRHENFDFLGEYPGAHRALLYRNVMIVDWHGQATLAAARNFGTLAGVALARSRQPMISSVHVINKAAQIPDAQTRAALLEIGEEFRARTACVGAIIVGSGFWASAMRGVVTGLRVVAPRTFDMRTFGGVSALIEWLPAEHAKRTGVTLDSATLQVAIEHVGKGEPVETH